MKIYSVSHFELMLDVCIVKIYFFIILSAIIFHKDKTNTV